MPFSFHIISNHDILTSADNSEGLIGFSPTASNDEVSNIPVGLPSVGLPLTLVTMG